MTNIEDPILCDMYLRRLLSVREIAKETGLTHGTVRDRLRQAGVTLRSTSESMRLSCSKRLDKMSVARKQTTPLREIDEGLVLELNKQGETVRSIGKQLHVSDKRIAEVLKRHGVYKTRLFVDSDRVAEASKLRESGLTWEQIGRRLGITGAGACSAVKRNADIGGNANV